MTARRRLSPDRRRGELLDAAAALALSAGDLDAASLERVAEAAGCSRNLAYRYFPNHAALVAELAERERTAVMDRLGGIPPGASFETWFAAVVTAVLDLAEERGRILLLLFEQSILPRSAGRRELIVSVVTRKLQHSGLPPERARVVAPVLAAALMGAAGVVVSDPGDRPAVVTALGRVVDALVVA